MANLLRLYRAPKEEYPRGMGVVDATVIGSGHCYYYEFYTTEASKFPGCKAPHRLGNGHFVNDDEAEQHARETWPKAFVAGIEMRCYD